MISSGMRVRMVQCLGEEPTPPDDSEELERWCAAGFSARPIQLHLDNEGEVLWVNEDCTICVAFDDGDERVLWECEIEDVRLIS